MNGIHSDENHFQILQSRAETHCDRILFKLRVSRCSDGALTNDKDAYEWSTISYGEFYQDVLVVASHILSQLKEGGVQTGAVVSLWVSSYQYIDAVYIMSLSRAGYIPHVCSGTIDKFNIVCTLMEKVSSAGLIYDGEIFGGVLENRGGLSKPTFKMGHLSSLRASSVSRTVELPPYAPNMTSSGFIVNSSGSVSGSPKPVFWTNSSLLDWIHTPIFPDLTQSNESIVLFPFGLANGAGFLYTFRNIMAAQCQVQVMLGISTPTITTSDIVKLISDPNDGVNTLVLPSTIAEALLLLAQSDGDLKSRLKCLRSVSYAGAALTLELSNWAFSNGILLLNLYGTTETAGLMLSRENFPSHILYPLPGTNMHFIELESTDDAESTSNDASNGLSRKPTKLYELIIPSSCPNNPIERLSKYFSVGEGDYHIGDYFEKVGEYDGARNNLDGGFIWRSRQSDFFKDVWGRRIDAVSIESDVRRLCPDIVEACILLGQDRPYPVLFIEPIPLHSESDSWETLKIIIVRNLYASMEARYSHERISHTKQVVFVESGALPRGGAKGNIVRKFAAEKFHETMSQIYTKSESLAK